MWISRAVAQRRIALAGYVLAAIASFGVLSAANAQSALASNITFPSGNSFPGPLVQDSWLPPGSITSSGRITAPDVLPPSAQMPAPTGSSSASDALASSGVSWTQSSDSGSATGGGITPDIQIDSVCEVTANPPFDSNATINAEGWVTCTGDMAPEAYMEVDVYLYWWSGSEWKLQSGSPTTDYTFEPAWWVWTDSTHSCTPFEDHYWETVAYGESVYAGVPHIAVDYYDDDVSCF